MDKHQKNKRNYPRMMAVVLIAAVLVVASLLINKARRTPSLQVQAYMDSVGADFQSLQEKLLYYEGGFVDLSKSVKTSQGAFYEIMTSRDYFSAVTDTKQDIADIEQTLQLITAAKEKKASIVAPVELAELEREIDEYYQHAEAGLQELLAFENFQLTMLKASGDELNTDIDNFDQQFQNLVKRQEATRLELIELTTLLGKIARLAEASSQRFASITAIPPGQEYYYLYQKEYHEDVARTFQQAAKAMKTSPQFDEELSVIFSDFFVRNTARMDARKADSKRWVETTPIKTHFTVMAELEPKILAFIADFYNNHDVIEVSPTPGATVTPSFSPEPTWSPEQSPMPSSVPTPITSPTPTTTSTPFPAATPAESPSPEPSTSPNPALQTSPSVGPSPTP